LRFIQKFRKQLGYQTKFAKQKPILSEEQEKNDYHLQEKISTNIGETMFLLMKRIFSCISNKQLFWVFRREKLFHRRPRHSPSLKAICGISIYGQECTLEQLILQSSRS
jgi:hypothetical protein